MNYVEFHVVYQLYSLLKIIPLGTCTQMNCPAVRVRSYLAENHSIGYMYTNEPPHTPVPCTISTANTLIHNDVQLE